jgi:hypothetical protein
MIYIKFQPYDMILVLLTCIYVFSLLLFKNTQVDHVIR